MKHKYKPVGIIKSNLVLFIDIMVVLPLVAFGFHLGEDLGLLIENRAAFILGIFICPGIPLGSLFLITNNQSLGSIICRAHLLREKGDLGVFLTYLRAALFPLIIYPMSVLVQINYFRYRPLPIDPFFGYRLMDEWKRGDRL